MIAGIAKSGDGVKLGAVDHASPVSAMLDSRLAILSDAAGLASSADRARLDLVELRAHLSGHA